MRMLRLSGSRRRLGFSSAPSTATIKARSATPRVSLGAGTIMFGQGDPGDQGVYVAVEDADAHYERAKAAGAEITRDIEDTPYGSREYSARDLAGHSWSFGTYRPGPAA